MMATQSWEGLGMETLARYTIICFFLSFYLSVFMSVHLKYFVYIISRILP
jgi:hypothetical protein